MLTLTFGCNNTQDRDRLVGEWRNVSITVTMKTVNGTDSTQEFRADQHDWEQKLGIQPIRTYYHADGHYVSKYLSPDDSLIRQTSGCWKIANDTLYMYQNKPDSVTYISSIQITGDTTRFELMLDWDQDGEKDDHYTGIQKKFSN